MIQKRAKRDKWDIFYQKRYLSIYRD